MSDIQNIREFNRFYARFLGLFDRYALGTEYSLAEARIIGEIGRNEGCTANSIARYLNIDRSYMSRIIDKFEKKEIIVRKDSEVDSRKICLWLTSKGKEDYLMLEKKSDQQVDSIIRNLSKHDLDKIQKSMNQIMNILNNESS